MHRNKQKKTNKHTLNNFISIYEYLDMLAGSLYGFSDYIKTLNAKIFRNNALISHTHTHNGLILHRFAFQQIFITAGSEC